MTPSRKVTTSGSAADVAILRDLILMTIDDMVADFIFYDRKEDEELPRDVLERAVRDGVVTVDEIVDRFKTKLVAGLNE
jgi:hypothetical protein